MTAAKLAQSVTEVLSSAGTGIAAGHTNRLLITQSVVEVINTPASVPMRVAQSTGEVLRSADTGISAGGGTHALSSQLVAEVLNRPINVPMRLSQIAAEVLNRPANPPMRLSQMVNETLRSTDSGIKPANSVSARITQSIVEVLRSPGIVYQRTPQSYGRRRTVLKRDPPRGNIRIVRQQESELPSKVTMQYINSNADYQQGSQSARRLATFSQQQVSISSPIVLDDIAAKNIVEKMLYAVWVERDRFYFKLSRKYAYLDPTDVITLTDSVAQYIYSVRIVKIAASHNGELDVEGIADHAPVYHQNATAAEITVVTQSNPVSTATNAVIMDLPVLRDQDDGLGFYIAMAGTGPLWGGGSVFQSRDSGATYAMFESSSAPSTIGTANNALGNWTGGDAFDEANHLSVTLDSGQLSSSTMAAVLNGTALAALATAGGWEVLQFRTAVLQAPVGAETRDTYLLSGFLRGRFGSEWAVAGHVAGNRFVLLDDANIRRVPITSAQLNVPLLYKVVTAGQALGDVTAVSITNTGVGLKPYSPIHLNGARSDSDGSMTLHWTRRSRVGGVWAGNVNVPLNEATELYNVEIWNANYTIMKRILTCVVENVVYTAAHQIADFGSVQAIIYFKIFQISATVGRGYVAVGQSNGV